MFTRDEADALVAAWLRHNHTINKLLAKRPIDFGKIEEVDTAFLAARSAKAVALDSLVIADDDLVAIVRYCGVTAGMRLANTSSLLTPQLHLFFRAISPRYGIPYPGLPWSQAGMAAALFEVGVLAANGQPPSNSNVSNTIRKAVFERGPAYEKPNYKERNWQYFQKSV